MGYTELLDFSEGELTGEPDFSALISRRVPVVQRLIDDFTGFYSQKFGVIATAQNDVALKISSAYFFLIYNHVKPSVSARTNRYKMASVMELIIVKEQVLSIDSATEADEKKVNAIFGMMAALSLINCMISDAGQEFFCDTLNASVDAKVHRMLDDHQLWLETKNPNEFPIFINAQFYECIALITDLPIQINGF